MDRTFKVIVDRREKNSLVAHELINLGIQIEFKVLPVADYLIGEIAIERKTIRDFINSIINKRIFRQLEEIKQFKKSIIIVEGHNNELGFNEKAIQGMILSIILDYEVPIIFTSDYEETASYIAILAKRLKGNKREIGLRAKKKVYSVAEQQQMIIEGFPSVGPSLAKALLKKFKTIKAIVNASEEDLCQVEKIGKKKARIIKKILEEIYNPRN